MALALLGTGTALTEAILPNTNTGITVRRTHIMNKKNLVKKALAGIFACAIIGSSALPAAQQGVSLFPLSISASAASGTYSLSNGVLTLGGTIEKSKVQAYANDKKGTVNSVVCKAGTSFPPDCDEMFEGFNAKTINLSNANVRNVKSMYQMFAYCVNLTTLKLDNWVTSSCTDMNGMFRNCYELKSLDLRSFSTGNVTDMAFMFDYCSALEDVDLSSFNTSSCTNMQMMFQNCSNLTSVRGWYWDTSKVTKMNCMFENCYNLTTISFLNGINTANVTDMSSMFNCCTSLTSLNIVKKFNTAKVTNMRDMFRGCTNLKTLDLRSFNTAKVTDMISMFDGCTNLTTIKASAQFATGQVKWDTNMFQGCSKLVGGNNTRCNGVNYIGKTYARIDKVGQKGYFTA